MDDAGNRRDSRSEQYFALGGFSINADEVHLLKELQQRMWATNPDLGQRGDEIKFAHVGSNFDRRKSPNPLVRVGMDMNARRGFVIEALESLGKIPSIEAIVAVVDKKLAYGPKPYEHAMTCLTERLVHSLSEKSERGMFICDEEQRAQKDMREVLDSGGSWYVQFASIVETILFVPSVWSPGVQFADLVAGSVARAMNYGDTKYMKKIEPYLRKQTGTQRWQGFGIVVFPNKKWPAPT